MMLGVVHNQISFIEVYVLRLLATLGSPYPSRTLARGGRI
jgi:hypothetical protein